MINYCGFKMILVLGFFLTRKYTVVIFSGLMMLILMMASSCVGKSSTNKKFKIGFSQCTGDSSWRKATLDALQRELAFHPGAELIYKNAGDNSNLQIQQIEELIGSDIDILLVSPNEAQPLTTAVEKVFDRGIPVIVVDRKVSSTKFTGYVGTDNFSIGKMAGDYILNTFPDSVNIIEITGLKDSSPTSERSRGFRKSLSGHPRVRIKASVRGNWLQSDAESALLNIREKLAPGDIIFAQNDPMILGAYEVYKSLGFEKYSKFIGVDGLPGPNGGIQLVSEKNLQATLLNPTGGEEAIQMAFKVLHDEPFDKEVLLSTMVIDSSNVRILKLQTDKIASLHQNILEQIKLLSKQKQLYRNQNVAMVVLIGALMMILVFGLLSYFALRNKRKVNKQLAVQNTEILKQSEELIELSAKAKDATDAKFNFFTNISHEFRTPLTLILVPLEDTLAASSLSHIHRNNLELAKKNIQRLLRLVNQLMDFRKIEMSKMKIRATENDIVGFIKEIAESFRKTARKKDIHLKVESPCPEIRIWFDVHMMDKIIMNLLSNAFKFTGESGLIGVYINSSYDGEFVEIKIQDTGIGMSDETAAHAFDLFYEGHELSHNSSGLGLALCKELVELHHGTITVKSQKWEGTCFDITLPQGKSHLSVEEIVTDETAFRSFPEVGGYMPDYAPTTTGPRAKLPSSKDQSLLIIEDNSELRSFLRDKFGEHFEIYEAATGNEGLAVAYELIPDLILCDVALPGTNGNLITSKLKGDSLTSHIPIIMLSSRDGINQHIEGMKNRADAFISKPFNLDHLKETMNSLLYNRSKLRDHYTGKLDGDKRAGAIQKTDRKFVNEFRAIVENSIGDENFGPNNIASEMCLSRMQLYRKVKSLLGFNVNDYILKVRLQRAKFLLLNSTESISDIAFKTGFSSPAYFSTVFRSKFGITPSEFRISQNEEE